MSLEHLSMTLFPGRIWALNHVIAPHGITDIVHAQVHKQYHALAVVYGGSTATGWALHAAHHDLYLYGMFGLLSIVHFRHDFVFPKWVLSTVALALMLQPSPLDAIFFYMVFVHVPNHYRMAWNYIRHEQILTFGLLFVSGAWCESYLLRTLLQDPSTIVSVIMGHILYQEYVMKTKIGQ